MKNIIILNKISQREKVISPVIMWNGKQYTGTHHADIVNNLYDNGIIDDSDFNKLELGLFLTNEGRVLNRGETREEKLLPTGDSYDIQEPITQEQLEGIFE